MERVCASFDELGGRDSVHDVQSQVDGPPYHPQLRSPTTLLPPAPSLNSR